MLLTPLTNEAEEAPENKRANVVARTSILPCTLAIADPFLPPALYSVIANFVTVPLKISSLEVSMMLYYKIYDIRSEHMSS
mmetsp:Transcript_17782/g.27665  ORF Transcript_17782/g.27665 Transcript_17782/m.27665 type:complete len:81 (+) Transcript_17782:2702-2944(+)